MGMRRNLLTYEKHWRMRGQVPFAAFVYVGGMDFLSKCVVEICRTILVVDVMVG